MNSRKDATRGDNLDPSNESSRTEIAIAKAEGVAYGSALKYLTTAEASDSGEREVGDYIVAYSIEDAEGLYEMRDGVLQWTEPLQENCHIEIAVRNASDGRFLPSLSITATVLDDKGAELQSFKVPFLWHPWVYHYGANRAIPQSGKYKLRIHIDVPTFSRHDRINGRRFEQPVDVEFDINIKTGRKLSPAA